MSKQGFTRVLLGMTSLCVSLGFSLPAVAAEATVPKPATLLAEPNPAASVVAELPANAKVETLTRQGFWQQVRFGGKDGWVKLTSIRLAGKSNVTLTGLAAVGTGRAGTGSVVSTSGTRGLQQQGLLEASPDYAAMDALEAVEMPLEEVHAFSRAAGLQTRQLPYVVKK